MFIESPQPADGDSVELAQTNGAESIGQISAIEGTAFITHTDGTTVAATDGAPIFQGDVIETGANGAIGITFADQSTFSLADNGSMVIDEMVYDPGSQSGKSALSVTEGVFTFVSGQIAKTDVEAMTITTPVAVIGIRGTSGGGKAGTEGTNNTFSLFQDASGATGEMTITTQGGAQTLSSPNQTTQIASAYVPPTQPVTLPPQAVAQFYAKATAVAPTVIVTQPSDSPANGNAPVEGEAPVEGAAQTDGDAPAEADAPVESGPVEGGPVEAGPVDGGPVEAGPAGLPDAAAGEAELAAVNAFDQVLAQGGSLEDAMAAGMNAATEAGLSAVLAADPLHFGSPESNISVMNRMANEITLGVTGLIDPLSAGTGSGTGAGNFAERVFFQNEIDHIIQDELGGLEGGLFGDFLGGGALFGGEGGFFEQFFDDPFQEFVGEIFFDPYLEFAGDEFFYEEPPPLFIDPEGTLTLTGDFDSPPPVSEFDDFLSGTTGNDNLFGGDLNTRFTMVQGASLGGTDNLNGGPGIDEVALENLSGFELLFDMSALSATYAFAGGSVSGQINLNSVEQLWADDGNEARVRLAFDDAGGGSGYGYILAGTSGNDTITAANGTTLTDITGAFGSISGSNITTGNIQGTIIFGGAGDDTITGSETGDVIYGGLGADTITTGGDAGGNGDAIFGGDGNDLIKVNAPGDIVDAGSPNIIIDGGLGTDTLQLVVAGTYTLATGPAAAVSLMDIEILDLAVAGITVSGSGTYFFNNLTSITTAGTGTISASDSSMNLSGVAVSASITTLTGVSNGGSGINITDANDSNGRILNGTADNDTLKGQGGGDTFNGGAGNDNLYLGNADGAADTVRYAAVTDFGSQGDIIYDFEQGAGGDVIDINTAFLSNGANSATLNELTSTAAALTIDDIFIELGGSSFTSTTTGTEAGALAVITALDTSNVITGDKVLFAMDDGTNTYLWRFSEDGTTANNATSGEIELVATISGLADAAGLNTGDLTASVYV